MPKLPTGAKLNQNIGGYGKEKGAEGCQVGVAVVSCYHGFKFHTQPTTEGQTKQTGAGKADLEPVRQPGDDEARKIQVTVTSSDPRRKAPTP